MSDAILNTSAVNALEKLGISTDPVSIARRLKGEKLYDACLSLGVINQNSGGWYVILGQDEKVRGKDNMISYLEDHKSRLLDLKDSGEELDDMENNNTSENNLENSEKTSGNDDKNDERTNLNGNGTIPLVERFDEMFNEVQRVITTDNFCIRNNLQLFEHPLEPNRFMITSKNRTDVWAILRRGRSWHTVSKGSLLRIFRQNPKLRPFFK